MRIIVSAVAVFGMALVLSSCSLFRTDPKELPPCPRVSVLGDASKLTRFRAGTGRDVTDVELQAEFARYSGSCTYDRDSHEMTVTMQVGIEAQRGPAARGRSADLAYFIAIPAFYPKPEAKRVLPVALQFPEDTDRVRYTDDEVIISFPVPRLADLSKYEVFVGLQLDENQLEFNRQNKGARQ